MTGRCKFASLYGLLTTAGGADEKQTSHFKATTCKCRGGFFVFSGNTVDVPQGFETDFASVPFILWFILPKWGKYGNAAVIHDYLYDQQTNTRLTADDIFAEAMTVLNVPFWQRFCLYTGVRLFGWWAWWLNSRKKALGYVKTAKAGPLKLVDRPGCWKTGIRDLPKILRGEVVEGKVESPQRKNE